jgi:hypothetical protein
MHIRNIFRIYVHPFPQVETQPMTRIYHITGAKIEGFLVDNTAPRISSREYGEKINTSKIGNYNAMNLIGKPSAMTPQPRERGAMTENNWASALQNGEHSLV